MTQIFGGMIALGSDASSQYVLSKSRIALLRQVPVMNGANNKAVLMQAFGFICPIWRIIP